tara:strand:- start:26308 stop:27180 length:873 start_codon:yes stop_codon:yes gene_type:complete
MAFRTKADFSRQIYQRCGTTAIMSGSTYMGDNLAVGYFSGDSYNFSVTETTSGLTEVAGVHTGVTTVVAINMAPVLSGRSSVQINPNTVRTGTAQDDMTLESNGDVRITLSSKRFKTNIEPHTISHLDNLLLLEPKLFTYKQTGEEDFGYIAEELDEFGLKDFVSYEPDGVTPRNIKYKYLAIGVIELLKKYKPFTFIQDKVTKVITGEYKTDSEDYIITKGRGATILLDDDKNSRVYIKSMTQTTIKPINGLIDEKWSEIELSEESSVELICHANNWYILSSDGIKNSN